MVMIGDNNLFCDSLMVIIKNYWVSMSIASVKCVIVEKVLTWEHKRLFIVLVSTWHQSICVWAYRYISLELFLILKKRMWQILFCFLFFFFFPAPTFEKKIWFLYFIFIIYNFRCCQYVGNMLWIFSHIMVSPTGSNRLWKWNSALLAIVHKEIACFKVNIFLRFLRRMLRSSWCA